MLKFKNFIFLYLSLINIKIYSNFTNNTNFKNIFFYNYKYTFKFKRNFNRNNVLDIGDKNKLILKADYIFNENIICGISLSKKQGEKFIFDNKTKRFFFNRYSYYLNLKNLKYHRIVINDIILGNFKLGYGQGLVFNYIDDSLNKPINITKIFKNQKGLQFSKSLKNKTFNGLGINFNIKQLELTLFGSCNKLNAFIYNNNVLSAKIIKNEKYNTINSLKKKDKLKQYSFGYALNYLFNMVSIGTCFVFTKYNKIFDMLNNNDFNNNFKQLDNIFVGNKHYNFSFFSKITYNHLKFYIEYAHSLNPYDNKKNYGYGLLTGFKLYILQYFNYYFLFRYYSNKYHNFYGNSYGIKKGTAYNKFKGAPNNEIGFYNGFKININSKDKLKLCSDIVFIPNQTFFFTKGFNRYFTIDFYHKISFTEFFNIQCKYNKEKYFLLYKMKNYNKKKLDIFKFKAYLKKNIHRLFCTKNYIFMTLNASSNKITKEDISLAFYEKFCYKYKNLNTILLFLYSFCKENSEIYVSRFEFDDKTYKLIKLDNHFIQIGTIINLKIYNKINIKGYYTFNYIIKKTRKSKYKNVFCVNISLFS